MGELKLIAENVKLNLGNNKYGHFNIYIDEEGKLEIHPFNSVGDLSLYSYILYQNIDGEYSLASRQND